MVGAAGGEPLDDDVALRDELIEVAVSVGKRLPIHLSGDAHALGAVGCSGKQWVVVDEAGVEER